LWTALALTVLFSLIPIGTGHAVGTGTLGVEVKARWLAGNTTALAGALVTAENVQTGATVTLSAYGNPATSNYYQGLGLPYGRYVVRVERTGFAPIYWPGQYLRSNAAQIQFGDAAGCNPADSATCDTHLLTIQVAQSTTLTGSVRHRSGAPTASAVVTARRDGEPGYAPVTQTDAEGKFALQLPPGDYSLSTPNGNTSAQASVNLAGPTVRDLTLLDPPSAPRNVTATAGNRSALVSWTWPADDGGAPVTSFVVTASPGAASCTTSGNSCTIPGLDNSVDYRFAVSATNTVGAGPASSPTEALRPTTATPLPPGNVRVSRGDRSVDVTWTASASQDVLEYTATARPGGRSCSTADLSCTIPGLRNGTAYTVAVTARSAAGPSPASKSSRTVTPAGLPSAPRSIQVKPRPSSLAVSWAPPLDDGGARVKQYVATSWPGGRTCASASTTCTIRGLKAGTDYSITLRAENAIGTGTMSPGSEPVSPKPGAAPVGVKGLRAVARDGRLTVRWNPAAGAKAYWIRLHRAGRAPGEWLVVTKPTAVFAVRPGKQSVQVRVVGTRGPGPVTTRTVTASR
jgi:hypothetical protein